MNQSLKYDGAGDRDNLIPDTYSGNTVKDDLATQIVKNIVSIRGASIAHEGSIIQMSIAHGQSIMNNSTNDSRAMKAMNDG